MKKIITIILVCLIPISFFNFFVFIYKPSEGRCPLDQWGSEWESEDKAISFAVDDHGFGIGKMSVGEESMDIFMTGSFTDEIFVYPLSEVSSIEQIQDDEHPKHLEDWQGISWRKDKWVIIVEKTTYFEEGQEITFKRVKKGNDQRRGWINKVRREI